MNIASSRVGHGAGAPRRPSRRVLVIDDDALIRAAIAEYLTNEGYSVDQAADGETGLWMAEQLQPDLILLDLALPMRSGLEVLKRLKEGRPTHDIPVIIVSAYATLLMRDQPARAEDVLHKPFDLQELLTRVNQVARQPQPIVLPPSPPS